jgi:hypothetical protein
MDGVSKSGNWKYEEVFVSPPTGERCSEGAINPHLASPFKRERN